MPAVAMQAVVSDDEKALVVESALHSLDSCSDQQERPLKATVPLHSHGSIPVDFGLRNAMAHTTQTGQRNKVTVNPAAEAEGVSEAVGSQLTGEVEFECNRLVDAPRTAPLKLPEAPFGVLQASQTFESAATAAVHAQRSSSGFVEPAPQDSRPLPYTTEAESAEALLALLRGPVTQGSSSSSGGGGDPLGQQPSTSFGRSSHSSQRSVPSRHYRSASVSPELTDDAASPSSSSRIMNPPPSNKQRRGGGKPTSIKPTTCKPTAAKLSPKPSSFQAAAQASGKRSSGKPRGGKRAKVRKPSSFVSHLYEMMLDPTLSHLCGFSSDGNSFYVTHSPEFPQTVLPQFFMHNRMRSFLRQLNQYSFVKEHYEDATHYSHPRFVRFRRDLLNQVRRRAPGEPAFTADPIDGDDDYDGTDAASSHFHDQHEGNYSDDDDDDEDEEDGDDEAGAGSGQAAQHFGRSIAAPSNRSSSGGRKRVSRTVTGLDLSYGSRIKGQRLRTEPAMEQHCYVQDRASYHACNEHAGYISSDTATTTGVGRPEGNACALRQGSYLYQPDYSVANTAGSSSSSSSSSSYNAFVQPHLSSQLPPHPSTLEDAANFHQWLTTRLRAPVMGFPPSGHSLQNEAVDESRRTATPIHANGGIPASSFHPYSHVLHSAPPPRERAAHEAAEVLGSLGDLSAASEAVAAASRILESSGSSFATHAFVEPSHLSGGEIGGGIPQPQQQDALIESSRVGAIDVHTQPKTFMPWPEHGDTSASQEGTGPCLKSAARSDTVYDDDDDDGQAANLLSNIAYIPNRSQEHPLDCPESQWSLRTKPRLVSEDHQEDDSSSSSPPRGVSPNTVAPFHASSFASAPNGNPSSESKSVVRTTEPTERLNEMPRYKNRPLGKTGHRFILKHEFVTKSGALFSGYALQVPKAFHGVSSFKHKDFQHTLNKRDELLMEWALAHTNLTPKAIEAWIATLDIEDTNQQFIE